MESWILTIVTFLPLVGIFLILPVSRTKPNLVRQIALGVSVLTFLFSLYLYFNFDSATADFQFVINVPWIKSLGISYFMGIDGISLFLILLTTFLTVVSILSTWTAVTEKVKGFMLAMLLLETGMIGVFVALDLFLFYVFWEAMLIPMYFLIGIWGHERRVYAAVKFILYTMIGSALMLVGILYLYRMTNSFDLGVIQSQIAGGAVALTGNAQS